MPMVSCSKSSPSRTVLLWPGDSLIRATGTGDGFRPHMDCYLIEDGQRHPAAVIFPGGAYVELCPHEGVDIACKLRSLGFHAFVVQYRTAPHRFPEPQQDALRAVRLVRQAADRWLVLADCLAVFGFSAGGHLAACTGTISSEIDADAGDAADVFDMMPSAMILGYPVISFGACGHQASGMNLLGDKFIDEKERFSLERRVGAHTPPTFLWHTATDELVPVENSLLFAAALHDHRRKWELHVFSHGAHGLGLASRYPDIAEWPELACNFLREQCGFPL